MSLSIACTAILEHRPVSVVARAIDVLVTSYSHSIKTGNHFKGTKSEKISPSAVPHVTGPRSSADVSASRVEALGKSIKHESTAGVDGSPNRSLTFSNSDSEESTNSEPVRVNLNDLHSVDGKGDRGKSAETSGADQLGPGNNPLNASASELQESQLTSPAVSPDEMYTFVFSPAEEEMVGDPSYLVAIMIEFLRRYVIFYELKSDLGL